MANGRPRRSGCLFDICVSPFGIPSSFGFRHSSFSLRNTRFFTYRSNMSLLTGFENFVRQGEPLAMHTWFQLGGPAEYFAEPETAEQLIALVRRCHAGRRRHPPVGPGIQHPRARRRRARHGDPPFLAGLLAGFASRAAASPPAAAPCWAVRSRRPSIVGWPGWKR